MGTWGSGYDENDDAADFLDQVSSKKDWSMVTARILDFMEAGGYADAQNTVAALELMAAAMGRPPQGMDPDLASWASLQQTDAARHRDASIQAVDAVRTRSELSELWSESVVDSNDRSEWHASIDGLKSRLAA